MNVLGLDTSTPAAAVCLLRDDKAAFEHEPGFEALTAPPAHARELLPAIVRCLDQAGLGWDDVGTIAVGVGPGGFTGLRIGIATARALAHAREIELRAVSSLAALAAGVEADASAGHRVLPLIDARRGELFGALYEGGHELWPPFTATPEALAARVADAGLKPLAVGGGSVAFRHVLESVGARVAPDGSRAHVVRGLSICRLAADAPPTSPEAVLPDYLRPPDAKPR